MKTQFYPSAALGLLAALAFVVLPARGAVTEAWVQRYNGPADGFDAPTAVAVDSNGNVVVTGYISISCHSFSGCVYDYYTAKYAATNGTMLWEKRYNSVANSGDQALSLAVDSGGNVVVTGLSHNGNDYDCYTAKYRAEDGALLWEQRYNGPANEHNEGRGVAIDRSGNVIVTGRFYGAGYEDSYTAKYAAADGALLWERRDPTGGAWALKLDGNDNVLVVGYFATIKYMADGTKVWTNSGGSALAVDSYGNVVVVSGSGRAVKYAALDGVQIWERVNGEQGGFWAAVAVDSTGNAVVTGQSHNGTNYDYYTTKYSAADGALLWHQRYDGPGNSHDEARAVAVDGSDNVVVTGTIGIFDANFCLSGDYYTAMYSAVDGALLWERRYNGPANGSDTAQNLRGLVVGPNGMVAVAGRSSSVRFSCPNTKYDYATVVYRVTLPPIITCPPNTVVDATGRDGAIADFTVNAKDNSFVPPIVTCAPASGSVFPIGQTTVTCTATDGDGLSGACSFTVTVRGARGVKQSVLAELIALRATVTDRDHGRQFDEAIAHLTRSLAAEFWVDETHLERKHGEKVFDEEKAAVRNLCDLIQSGKSQLPDAVLQGFVDQLIQADRLLASVAIEEAIAAGLSGKKIEQAQKFLARGDAEAADGQCANGIEEYRKAWKRAARAKVSPPVRLANGRVRLEIAGEPGERFTLQCSSNLKDWLTLGNRTANAEGLATFEDADAGPHPTRFYQVVEE